MDGIWTPLPTRPQRYCDPASLVKRIMNFTRTEIYERKAVQVIIQEQKPEVVQVIIEELQPGALTKKQKTPSKTRERPRPITLEERDAIIKKNQVERTLLKSSAKLPIRLTF